MHTTQQPTMAARGRRRVRVGIALLRVIAHLLLVAGVWGVPIAFVAFARPRAGDAGPFTWWPWAVAEVFIATIGLSLVTWWVADWLDERERSRRQSPRR